MEKNSQAPHARIYGNSLLLLCVLFVSFLLIFPSPSYAQEDKLFQLNDSKFQRVILVSPDVFDEFQGVKFKPFSPDKMDVESNRKNWKKNTEKYIPELTGEINEKISNHNERYANTDASKLLVAELQFGKVMYQRGVVVKGNQNVNSRIKEDDDDFLVQNNPSEVVILAKVVFSHPETEQMLGMADHVIRYYSYKRTFLEEKIESYVLNTDTTWDKGNQHLYWSKISDYVMKNIEPTLAQIKTGGVKEFK